MSISISGVRGYEFQYKVIAFIALAIGIENIKSYYVESETNEDAEIEIDYNGKIMVFEVQVKSEKTPIDIHLLATWLSHFKERKTDNSLFTRIKKDRNRAALFVAQSRCNDNTHFLCNKIPFITEHEIVQIDANWENTFIKSLTENKEINKSRTLRLGRKLYLNNFFQNKSNQILNEVLRKTIIWEHV